MSLLSRREFCAGLLVGGVFTTARALEFQPAGPSGISLAVPFAPAPVRIRGSWTMVYELHVRNDGPVPIDLEALTAYSRAPDAPPFRAVGSELSVRMAYPERQTPTAQVPRVLPAQRAVIYLELPAETVPRHVLHEVVYRTTLAPETLRTRGREIPVSQPPRLALGPPLKGGPWVAVYSPVWPRGHRRVFYDVDGREILPGRFAIDWVRVDEKGRLARTDENRVADHYGYGEPVLAVSDGRIAAVRDTMSEPTTLDAKVRHSLDEAAGNYVALELPDGRFAVYEHLKPGSVGVREGQRVRAGHVLAELGFTGDSTGPHLHLHVSESPQPLRGEGVAFHLGRFTLLGQYDDIGALGKDRWQSLPDGLRPARGRELPSPNAVLLFDAG